MLDWIYAVRIFGRALKVTPHPGRITRILDAARRGDPAASEELLPLVYDQLRKLAHQRMARERPGQTLQPTGLVHEAYLRLVGDQDVVWENRAHFFAAAASAMRRIMIERARRLGRVKHGGDRRRVTFEDDKLGIAADPEGLIALDQALTELEAFDKRMSQVVSLRYFAGLTIDETAQALGLSKTTVKDDWKFARAWLFSKLNPRPAP